MENFYAPIDENCTVEDVNAALIDAGRDDMDVFYDPYNNGNLTISRRKEDEHGHPYYQDQRTRYDSPYWLAQAFERGEYD